MTNSVQYSVFDEGYGLIQLNRPEKHNAISKEMTSLLSEKIKEAKNDSIKCLVVTGVGDKSFCSGGDLNNMHGDLSNDEAFRELYQMKECLYELLTFPVPTICLLNGNALGGGCEIATACDFRIGKEETEFGFIQSTLGIVPGWGGGAILYEKVNPDFAFQWIVEGSVLSIDELKFKGWIHRIIARDEWENTQEILKPYLTKSMEQMKLLKSQFNKKISTLSLSATMNEEVRNSANLWDSPEHIQALKKRKK